MEFITDHPIIAIAVVVWTLIILFSSSMRSKKLPDLPWVGKVSKRIGADYWATWASIGQARNWFNEGYQKFSKRGKAYILPDSLGFKHVVLSNEKLGWILEQPDSVLSVGASHYDTLAGDYSFGDPTVLGELFHEHVIHKTLARKLGDIIPRTWEGVCNSLDELWGTDTQNWKDITVMDNFTHLMASITNYFLVGEPHCNDKQFLKDTRAFADDVVLCIFMNQLLPDFLKPALMPIVSLPNRYHTWKTAKALAPTIKQRLADIEAKASDPKADVHIPEDYITWHSRIARDEGRLDKLEPNGMVRNLMAIEFAANHTSLLSIANAVIDLVGSDPKHGYIEGIQEEVERVYKEYDGVWTKQALGKLIRTDSAIRESMRMVNVTFAVTRKVVAQEGIRNEEEGWFVPYGHSISVAAEPRHMDPDVYPNPKEYDAFRFSRDREAYEARISIDKNADEHLKLQAQSLISTSKDFLPFGHGRHACPGRFFIQQEFKMIFAYMVMNYDLERLPSRPPNIIWGPINTPPPKTTIRVRRRAGNVAQT